MGVEILIFLRTIRSRILFTAEILASGLELFGAAFIKSDTVGGRAIDQW